MKSIFIDTNRMGRTVHFGTDVIFHPCKCPDQTRFCLHPGLIGVRNVIRQRTDHSSVCCDSLLDFPFLHTEQFGHVQSRLRILRDQRKCADWEQKPLGDLPPELHGSKPKAFAHNVCLPVTGCPEEFKFRCDRQKAVHLKVDRQIHFPELSFVHDALPAKDMGEFNLVSILYWFNFPYSLYTCQFSHLILFPLSIF